MLSTAVNFTFNYFDPKAPVIHSQVEAKHYVHAFSIANDSSGLSQYLSLNPIFDRNEFDNAGFTPLHLAAQYEALNCVSLLLASGAHIDQPSRDGQRTPLHIASENADPALIKELLAQGANLKAATEAGQTPLSLAFHQTLSSWDRAERIRIELDVVVIDELLKEGVNLNALTKKYASIIEEPAEEGRSYNAVIQKYVASVREFFPKETTLSLATQEIVASMKNWDRNKREHILSQQDGLIRLVLPSKNDCENSFKCLLQRAIASDELSPSDQVYCLGLLALIGKTGDVQDDIEHVLRCPSLNINAFNSEGFTALHLAVKYGSSDCARRLLDAGASIDLPCQKGGKTPLHIAFQIADATIVQELLARGANVNALTENGETPVSLAFNQTIPSLYRTTRNASISKGIIFPSLGDCKATFKCLQQNADAVQQLSPSDQNLCLEFAALTGATDGIENVLACPTANINSRTKRVNWQTDEGVTLLMLATWYKHSNIITLYLQQGAKDELNDKPVRWTVPKATAFEYALMEMQHPDSKTFLEYDAEFANRKNELGNTPLFFTVFYPAAFESVKLLIDYHASVDEVNGTDELTALHNARGKKNLELLITAGANVNKLSRLGLSPLFFASKTGFLDGVMLLYSSGANVNQPNGPDQFTALHIAVECGQTEVVRWLIQQPSCNIDAKAVYQESPRHASFFQKLREETEIDKDMTVIPDLTPLHIAIIEKQEGIVKLLLGSRTYDDSGEIEDANLRIVHKFIRGLMNSK